MKRIWFKHILCSLITLALIDSGIVLLLMVAIISGDTGVQHIPFWDAQIKFVVNLINY